MRCFCSTLHYSYQCMLFLKGWNEIPEGQMAGTSDAFQTPGVCLFLLSNLHIWKKYFINNTLQSHLLCLNIMLWQAVSNRLSFGMTPKTVRLPKNGEMLLSVHGSPLGVYKEENLAAIQGIHHVLLLIFLYRKPHLVLSCQVIIFLLPESGNGDEDAPSWCTRCTSKKVGVID